jgi:hypothetical protein
MEASFAEPCGGTSQRAVQLIPTTQNLQLDFRVSFPLTRGGGASGASCGMSCPFGCFSIWRLLQHMCGFPCLTHLYTDSFGFCCCSCCCCCCCCHHLLVLAPQPPAGPPRDAGGCRVGAITCWDLTLILTYICLVGCIMSGIVIRRKRLQQQHLEASLGLEGVLLLVGLGEVACTVGKGIWHC